MKPEPYDTFTVEKTKHIQSEIDNAISRVWKQKRQLYVSHKRGKHECAARAAEAAAVALKAGAFAKEKGDWYFLDQDAKKRKIQEEIDRYQLSNSSNMINSRILTSRIPGF